MNPKYYGVSSGNGNDGVSQLFPDYIVKTDDPFELARRAAISHFTPGKGQQWAEENMQVDGDEESTIYATFYESPETQEERVEMQKRLDEMEEGGEARELEHEIEGFGMDYAWLVFEIFPWTDDLPENRPVYESIEDCF